ncbi:MAG: hypothetical protein QME05_03980 [Candidatus Margulisbacteria bacterium]|nr:hypothetical protein [Candidatus Margulisiibacteriota bacterium]
MKISSFSAAEIELLTRLEFEGKEIYTREQIVSFCKTKLKAVYLIKKLLEKKRLRKTVKNVYLLVPMKAPGGQWAGNEYIIAKALARGANYYIGYSPVFSSYGFTDQVARVIYVINDHYSAKKDIFGTAYKMVKVMSDKLYGLEERRIGSEFVAFPKKERAMIDVFEFYATDRAAGILNKQLKQLNLPLFIEYVAQYPVRIIRRKIGYLLEQLGIEGTRLNKIKVGDKGYSPLYGKCSGRGKVNKKWRIIING